MKTAAICLGLLIGAALPSIASGQVTLSFDDLALPDYGQVPATYGDGLDPNVPDVQYRTLHPTSGATISPYVEFWQDGYGDLGKVVYADASGYVAEIRLVPAEGYGVRLVSFDLAGYPYQDKTATVLRVVDGNGDVVLDLIAAGQSHVEGNGFDAGGETVPAHSTFLLNLTVAGPLALQWGVDWDIGLDNLTFEAVPLSAIPEAAHSGLVVALAMFGVAAWQGRRRGLGRPVRP